MEGAILQLTAFSEGNPRLWEVLVGLFFQETNVNPSTIDTQYWVKDVRRQDILEKGQVTVETWGLPAKSTAGGRRNSWRRYAAGLGVPMGTSKQSPRRLGGYMTTSPSTPKNGKRCGA